MDLRVSKKKQHVNPMRKFFLGSCRNLQRQRPIFINERDNVSSHSLPKSKRCNHRKWKSDRKCLEKRSRSFVSQGQQCPLLLESFEWLHQRSAI
jgi:hypothetical protein